MARRGRPSIFTTCPIRYNVLSSITTIQRERDTIFCPCGAFRNLGSIQMPSYSLCCEPFLIWARYQQLPPIHP